VNIDTKLKLFEVLRIVTSIAIALMIVCGIVLIISKEPSIALRSFLLGPFSGISRFGNVIEMMIPLTFTGLAVCIMFRANQFNMIAEGAFYMAAVFAALTGIFAHLPPIVLPFCALLAGALVGGALGAVPAVLKIKTNSSVIVVSLMMNYILMLLGRYIATNVMRDPKSGSGSSFAFQKIAKMPVIISGTRIHLGFVFMILAVIFVTILIYRSKLGYSIRMIGLNDKFSLYSGINVNRTIILSQVFGGMLAGLGGSIEMLGLYNRFSWVGSPGYGWDAVIISILAKGNPLFIPLAAFFLSYIRIGADTMSMNSDVPAEIVAIAQAIIIMLLVAKLFLSSLREHIVRTETINTEASGEGRNSI
jgi:simple sugar transport system permease protein